MIKILLTIYSILSWHKRTFPKFSCQEQQEKLVQEIREWEEALEEFIRTGSQNANTALKFELADIVISAINLMRYEEINKLVQTKMIINQHRTWNNGQHKGKNND